MLELYLKYTNKMVVGMSIKLIKVSMEKFFNIYWFNVRVGGCETIKGVQLFNDGKSTLLDKLGNIDSPLDRAILNTLKDETGEL